MNKLQCNLYILLREDIELFAKEHQSLTIKDVIYVLKELLHAHRSATRLK